MGEPELQPVAPGVRPRIAWAAVLFPVALWAGITLTFAGDYGRYLDDYYLNLRDVETGAYRWGDHPWQVWPYFWRPLHLILLYGMGTALPGDVWAWHMVNAISHGACAICLFWLLRRLGMGARLSAGGSLVFLATPINYEVVYWFSTVSTGIGTVMLLVGAVWYAKFARAERGWWWIPILLGVWAFLIACWYEVPAAGVASYPALTLALGPKGMGLWKRWARGFVSAVPLGLGCAAYAGLLMLTAPSYVRGADGRLTGSGGVGQVVERGRELGGDVWEGLTGVRAQHGVLGSFEFGLSALGAWWGVVGLVVVGALGCVWVFAWVWRDRGRRGDAGGGERSRTHWVIGFGIAMAVAGWAPVLLAPNESVRMRMYYVSSVGAVIAGVALLDGIGRQMARARGTGAAWAWGGRIGAVGLVLVALAGGVCLVGWQALYRERARRDAWIMEQLVRLVPDPGGDAVFVPMSTEDWAARTGYNLFDQQVKGALAYGPASRILTRETYKSASVTSTHFNPWQRPALRFARWRDGSVRYDPPRTPFEALLARLSGEEAGPVVYPYSRMIPYVVGADSGVTLVERAIVTRPGRGEMVVDFPRVRSARSRGAATTEIGVADPHVPGWLEGGGDIWRWTTGGGVVGFKRERAWGESRSAVRMIAGGGGRRSGMRIDLPASDDEREMVFHITIAEEDLEYVDAQRGVVVRWDDGGRGVHARARLTGADFIDGGAWHEVRVAVPGSSRGVELFVRVRAVGEGDRAVRVLVSEGEGAGAG